MRIKEQVITEVLSQKSLPILLIDKAYVGNMLYKVTLHYDYPLNSQQLQFGLKTLIQYYPAIAGYTQETHQQNHQRHKGILFLDKIFDCNLPSNQKKWLQLENIPNSSTFLSSYQENDFYCKVEHWQYKDASIIEFYLPHFLCDGPSLVKLLIDWSLLSRKKTILCPIFDKSQVLESENTIRQECQGISPQKHTFKNFSDIEKEECIFHISGAYDTKKLKSEKLKQSFNPALINNLWIANLIKKISQGIDPKPMASLPVSSVYNIRSLLGIPNAYFGNLSEITSLDLSMESIQSLSIMELSQKIFSMQINLVRDRKQLLNTIHRRILLNQIPQARLHEEMGGIRLNNMSQLDFYHINFGSGKPCWIELPVTTLGFLRRIRAFPSPSESKGICAHICLPTKEMDHFKQLMR